jgi:hypothetical protein
MRDNIIKIEYDPDEEEDEKLFCPKCSAVGLNIVLGSKILMPQELRPADYENWLQCVRCGFLCPIYEGEKEATIQDTVTTIENPFDNAQGQLLGAFKKKKATRTRSKRSKKTQHHKDPDINLEIKCYGEDNVKVIHS